MELTGLLLEFERALEEAETSVSEFVAGLGMDIKDAWVIELIGVYAEDQFKRGNFATTKNLKEEFPALALEIDEVVANALANFTECYCPVSNELGTLPAVHEQYHFIREIGRGGSGVVYEAREPSLNRSVAIKVPFSPESEVVREARALSRIEHPNCAAVYGFGKIGDFPFLVMRLIHGEPLKKHCRRPPSLTPKRAVRVMIQVVDAIVALHSRGIAHRDLKPSNVMLEEERPIVVDFGLASRPDDFGNGMGSPGYIAPELFEETPVESLFLCDLFSLGVILYELLTGNKPFGATRDAIKQPPRRCRDYRAEVDEELERICLKAIDINPQHRFQTAQSFRDALRRWLGEDDAPDQVKSTRQENEIAMVNGVGHRHRRKFLVANLVWGTLLLCSVVGLMSPHAATTEGATSNRSPLTLNAYRSNVVDDSITLLGTVGHSDFVVRRGDYVSLSRDTQTPCYCYLVAANPDGTLQFLFESESLVKSFRFPQEKDCFFSLGADAGVQAFILISTPDRIEQWQDWVENAPDDTGWNDSSSLTGVWESSGTKMVQVMSLVERGDIVKVSRAEPLEDLIHWLRQECSGDIYSIAFQIKR